MGGSQASREREVVDTFIRLADTLASDYDIAALLQLLVERCTELLGVDTAGVLVESLEGDLRLAAATSEKMHDIETAELTTGEGPCVEAYRSREPVIVPDLTDWQDRWPNVMPMLLDLGMGAGHAFPLRLRDDCIGALNLYRRQPSGFGEADIRLAQAFADIAAIGITHQRTVAKSEERAAQLQHALDSRILIEQAKGVLAQQHRITPNEAWEALRTYARNNQMTAHELSKRVVDGTDEQVVIER